MKRRKARYGNADSDSSAPQPQQALNEAASRPDGNAAAAAEAGVPSSKAGKGQPAEPFGEGNAAHAWAPPDCVPWSLPEVLVPPRLTFIVLAMAVMPASQTAGQMLAVRGSWHEKAIAALVLLLIAAFATSQVWLAVRIGKRRWQLGLVYGTLGFYDATKGPQQDAGQGAFGPGSPANTEDGALGHGPSDMQGPSGKSFIQVVARTASGSNITEKLSELDTGTAEVEQAAGGQGQAAATDSPSATFAARPAVVSRAPGNAEAPHATGTPRPLKECLELPQPVLSWQTYRAAFKDATGRGGGGAVAGAIRNRAGSLVAHASRLAQARNVSGGRRAGAGPLSEALEGGATALQGALAAAPASRTGVEAAAAVSTIETAGAAVASSASMAAQGAADAAVRAGKSIADLVGTTISAGASTAKEYVDRVKDAASSGTQIVQAGIQSLMATPIAAAQGAVQAASEAAQGARDMAQAGMDLIGMGKGLSNHLVQAANPENRSRILRRLKVEAINAVDGAAPGLSHAVGALTIVKDSLNRPPVARMASRLSFLAVFKARPELHEEGPHQHSRHGIIAWGVADELGEGVAAGAGKDAAGESAHATMPAVDAGKDPAAVHSRQPPRAAAAGIELRLGADGEAADISSSNAEAAAQGRARSQGGYSDIEGGSGKTGGGGKARGASAPAATEPEAEEQAPVFGEQLMRATRPFKAHEDDDYANVIGRLGSLLLDASSRFRPKVCQALEEPFQVPAPLGPHTLIINAITGERVSRLGMLPRVHASDDVHRS